MIKARSARIEEFEKVVELINKVFRTTRGHEPTMQQEFPLLINKNNVENMVIVEKEQEIVSDVNYLIQDVLVQGTKVKVASIGGVCTDPKHERKGYASKILDYVEKKLYEEGVEVLLISGNRTLYTRRMCSRVKNFYKYTIKPEDIILDLCIEEYDEKYLNQMINRYHQSSTRYVRTKEQFKMLLKAGTIPWGTYTYKKLVIKKEDKLIGYMVIRLIDEEKRRGEIIELNIPNHYVRDIIAHIAYQYDLNDVDYWVHVKDTQNHLENYDEVNIDDLHGTIKIIHYEKLCKSLYDYFVQYVEQELLDHMEFKDLDVGYLMKYKNEAFFIKDVEKLNQLFFAGLVDEKELEGKTNIENFIRSVFPLPFIWPANLNYQ
ncbi:GNAT family N-acetyltransferase [Crassaminicella profunda]|uniref:GNAT family N-acetyltransferase n=1 Tax=Crassaminicella profunda TaxID=1286698 RepID=UPI001CA66047|nr:GNAT family N-acetyltransferase [Crassaminicella profunda]QZY54932.1 GNAT family N-acetyltransferase [Crassaminicella profunda]